MTDSPDEIEAFLLAQYDRAEKAAKLMAEYYPPPWEVFDRGWMARVYGEEPFWEVTRLEQGPWVGEDTPDVGEIIEHVALNGPDYVLADIASKRRIVALHSDPRGGDPSCSSLDYPESAEDCETLRLLALPFASRDGYKESWRP